MYREITPEKKRFLFNQAVMEFFKINQCRLASHSLEKSPGPLANRADIQPLLPLVKNDPHIDVLGLDDESRVLLCSVVMNDELAAHPYNDEHFLGAMKAVLDAGVTGVHFAFFTNGIVMPDLAMHAEWDELLGRPLAEVEEVMPVVEFYETRVKIEGLAKLSNHKIYQRQIVERTRRIGREFFESDVEFEGEACWEGRYDVTYHGKTLTLPYWISPDSGVQLEAPDNLERVGEFVSGFK